MPKIVVSYRRADSAAIAGRIFDRLVHRYGEDAVFMDVDHIPIGTDFRHHIQQVVETCDAFVAVVGPNWTGEGEERIRQGRDPVRVEVESALRRGVPIIPVLVDGARMPEAAELPDSLQAFAYINAAEVRIGRDFRQHMDRLTRTLDAILGQKGTFDPPPATQAATLPAGAPRSRRSPLWRMLPRLLFLLLFVGAAGGGLAWWNGWLQSAPPLQQASSRPEAPVQVAAPPAAPVAAPAATRTSTPVAAPPPQATYRVLANVSTGVQNMRSGPATRYPIVVVIPAGSTGITLSNCRKSEDGTRPWCAAQWRTHAGWISICCIVDERTGAPPPRID